MTAAEPVANGRCAGLVTERWSQTVVSDYSNGMNRSARVDWGGGGATRYTTSKVMFVVIFRYTWLERTNC